MKITLITKTDKNKIFHQYLSFDNKIKYIKRDENSDWEDAEGHLIYITKDCKNTTFKDL